MLYSRPLAPSQSTVRTNFGSGSNGSGAARIAYRADIDGLRAIAVIAVVLFHVGTNVTNGGFVGVDIFFVISGYLITQTIDREIRDRRFSLAAFYERRARRIFPALFGMFAATFVAAVLLLRPADFMRFAESLIAASLFVANVFFVGEGQRGILDGHFPLPLLHTWSLAVEEQFYLVFPPLLIFLSRKANAREKNGLLWLITIASFILSMLLAKELPVPGLYLAQSRAWELLGGVLLGLGAVPYLRSQIGREALGLIGLLLVAAGVVLYTTKTPFPGVPALAPALGALCVIYSGAGEKTLVSRVLGSRIPVWFGLISYSLYLWHWPIMTMTDLVIGHPLDKLQKVAVVASSVGVAYLSWRFIEQPFRRRGANAFSRAAIFRLSFSAIAIACSLGIVVYIGDGWPGRPDQRFNHAGAFASAGSGPASRALPCAARTAASVKVDRRLTCGPR